MPVAKQLNPRGYTRGLNSSNATSIDEYSRGLAGVDIARDRLLSWIMGLVFISVCLCVLCVRMGQWTHAYLRKATSVAVSLHQNFWSVESSSLWSNIKRHILYAPLLGKRHNREIRLGPVNVATIPSRLHTIFILSYLASQVLYCTYLNYQDNEKAALVAELRGRSGTLAVLNMIPLFLLACRNNPLIPLLHISFNTYNLFHRWLGRIVVLEVITHVITWGFDAAHEGGLKYTLWRIRTTSFFQWGCVGAFSFCFLLAHSVSPIRHVFYETFLHLHQLAALLAFIGVYMHLNLDKLPQLAWLKVIAVLWALERTIRIARLVHLNYSLRNGHTKVTIQALPSEACLVTLHLPKSIRINPGCHVYAYIPSISFWMSHPFSVAWAEPPSYEMTTSRPFFSPPQAEHGLEPVAQDGTTTEFTTLSLIIVARQGMTRRLYQRARASPNQVLQTTGFAEGPYSSGPFSIGSYGTVVLFSGGAGITHHLMYVRELIRQASDGQAATQKLYLIWCVRDSKHLGWIQGFLGPLLELSHGRQILTIKLFVSQKFEIHHTSFICPTTSVVEVSSTRCRPACVLNEILSHRAGATIVSVCGPGRFSDDVRDAVRTTGQSAVMDFVEEAFTW